MREKSERQSKSEEVERERERERESQREPRELERNLWGINFFFKTLQNVVILLI